MADIQMPVPPQAVSWQAQEVVKEIDKRPHLLVRVVISGAHFPHRGAEPFVRVLVGERPAAMSWFADVGGDNRSLAGYFAVEVPKQGTIEYGYGGRIWGRVEAKFDSLAIKRLDRKRLPEETVVVSEEFLKTKREGRLPTP